MKILFIGHETSRTGAPISLFTLIKGIQQKNPSFEVTVLLLNKGVIFPEYKAHFKTFTLSKPIQSRFLRTRQKIISFFKTDSIITDGSKFINELRPDAIYINTVVPLKVFSTWEIKYNPKIYCHVREQLMVIKHYLGNNGLITFDKMIDHYFVVSGIVESVLIYEYGVSPNKITIAPGPFDLSNYKPTGKTETEVKDQFVVASAGTPTFRKGIDIVIQTADFLKNSSITFKWYGRINSPEDINYNFEIEKRSLGKIVNLEGESSHLNIELAKASLFFMCSREDPFPRVAVEAALSKLPVIYFKGLTGVEDFIQDGISGISVDYLDYNQIENAIIKLKNNPELAIKMGERAYQSAVLYLKALDTITTVVNKISS